MNELIVGEANLENILKENLLNRNYLLTIPSFQRPYSWDEKQVIQLIKDLNEAYKNNKSYLIGNMILYKGENLEIIDGQQRITTLSLLLKVLGSEVNFLNNKINPLSAKKLKENFDILKNYFKNNNNKESFKEFLLKKVKMTYMITNDLDEAFVLFDSQNTRGKPLKRKDILKVHHIHPINENREIYAKKWEKWEGKEKKNFDKLDELLYLISFIRRRIRGVKNINDLVSIDVFEELKQKVTTYKLNNYNQIPIFESFEFDFKNNLLSTITKPLKYKENKIFDGVKFLPFEIGTAISSGENFFAYVWKYWEIFNEISKKEYFKYFDRAYGSGNEYLKKIFKTTLFFYYDKFGEENIEEFTKRIYTLLGYLRAIKTQIRKEKVLSFEWNERGQERKRGKKKRNEKKNKKEKEKKKRRRQAKRQ